MLASPHPRWDGEREKQEVKPRKCVGEVKNCSVSKRDLEEERKITKQVMQRQSLTTSPTQNNAPPVPKTGKANSPKSPPLHYHC